jgi:flavin-dependent dehydrogenase
VDSRAAVDDLVAKAVAAGGRPGPPARAEEARYTDTFSDPDGNAWEVVWMDRLHSSTDQARSRTRWLHAPEPESAVVRRRWTGRSHRDAGPRSRTSVRRLPIARGVERTDTAVSDLTDTPRISSNDEDGVAREIHAEILVGADGSQGTTKWAIPQEHRRRLHRVAEGTDSPLALIVGRDITGSSAFR